MQYIHLDPEDFTVVSPSDKHAWTKMFVEYFLTNAHCTLPQCSAHSSDDMLWYVRPPQSFFVGNQPGNLDVFRRDSKKQPLPGEVTVNWEETVYLNLILHQVIYTFNIYIYT